MEWIYIAMVIFLFTLTIFNLWVGVSNDAVNFLNSAIGSKAAKFRTIIIVAGIGILCGSIMSNGMMDIARNGIMQPTFFCFNDVMIVFLAVMVTNVILIDVFNTLGMPTSTTVSLVFNLLGASSAIAFVKIINGSGLLFSDYINTNKALEVIFAIFLSVALAFVFGIIVQFFVRLIFTFNYQLRMKWKIGLFGGTAVTVILYFILFKDINNVNFLSMGFKQFIDTHLILILFSAFVFFTLLMQLLHHFGVSVLKTIILLGTFALAAAFAGNDMVNFLGVPLAGFSSYLDFQASGATDATHYMMIALNQSANTPSYFLIISGIIMILALATSEKARNVTKTEIGLSSQQEGAEMFGSSRIARSIVRAAGSLNNALAKITPAPVIRFVNKRFAPVDRNDNAAAYDLIRASVNLVVASLLIALGTSFKLPLSTTYVTFMVAMGSSLADRAWGRESAVFRVTGVLTVIGGWFITAGIAFVACFAFCLLMYYGGIIVILLIVLLCIASIFKSQRNFHRKKEEKEQGDLLFYQILHCQERKDIASMLRRHVGVTAAETLKEDADLLLRITDSLFYENLHRLRSSLSKINKEKEELKNLRNRETICLKRTLPFEAISLSTPFHLIHNALSQMRYGLLRMAEPALEHVDNHFSPIPKDSYSDFIPLRDRLIELSNVVGEDIKEQIPAREKLIKRECLDIVDGLKKFRHTLVVNEIKKPKTDTNSLALLFHITGETEQFALQLLDLFNNCQDFFKTDDTAV